MGGLDADMPQPWKATCRRQGGGGADGDAAATHGGVCTCTTCQRRRACGAVCANEACAASRHDPGLLNNNLKKCGSCKCVAYCGKQCQRADWRRHKGECKRMADGGSSS